MAAEEQGKIVSAGLYPKSYLPAHSVMYNILRHYLCIFADAIRIAGAEAKIDKEPEYTEGVTTQSA